MKVLLADHEPMWQDFISTRLRNRGLQPISVVNGERAWSVLQERDAPRLVIIARRIPSLDGTEICRLLRARADAFYTYVLLLVPNLYRVDELLALESGADDCLAKPFTQEELYARIAIAQRVLGIDKRLTEINGRWRTLIDTLPFGVASVDENGILKRMNTTFANLMGYTNLRDLLGQSLSWVITKQIDVNGLLEQIRWGEPFSDVEVQCRSTKGKPRPVRVWGRPLPKNDEAVYEVIVQEVP